MYQKEYEDAKRILKIVRINKCKYGIIPSEDINKFNIPLNGLMASLLEEYYLYRTKREENNKWEQWVKDNK